MKTTFFYAVAFSAIELALAQPHHHAHRHAHKRSLVTTVEIKTVTASDVTVYVDEAGETLSSNIETPTVTFEAISETTSEPSIQTAEISSVIQPEIATSSKTHVPLVEKSLAPPAVTPKPIGLPISVAYIPSSIPAVPLPLPSSSNNFPLGIAYSPFLVGGCKTKEQVAADFLRMGEFGIVRLYGTECNQIASGVAAAKATNKKLIVGIYDIKQVDAAVKVIKNEGGDFSTIKLITVGNEGILNGHQASEIVAAVKEARTKLAAIGYKGLISSVDTFGDTIAHKELCDNSDITTVNAQAFFTNTVTADQAGQYVRDRVNDVRNVCGKDKLVVVTESGWPSSGDPNGAAVPGRTQQRMAIASLKEKFKDGNMVLFSAFNDEWKTDTAATFNAEKHYGILDQ
ncbi:glycoside hydrolase [Pseudovirgaria hyperparasitica]|uniref:Glycoside hydrolase n=1 Tax=Pseudovirgaria hyperparasitica TaxID=470096 RepID=A0A6A6WGD8_9PEZI|nr:glycoside hydrolase [Pseudovirgaria hyperparasitica]KAF2760697.1 glycoside hydrolase [Pseudovirgaria hyperparasitica]